MSKAWPLAPLGEVLSLVDTAVPTTQLGEIKLAGVYSFGRDLFRRGPMSPDETSYKTYNRLVTDDYIISQPKAWEGAIARVIPDFDGWFLSPVFPIFRAGFFIPDAVRVRASSSIKFQRPLSLTTISKEPTMPKLQ